MAFNCTIAVRLRAFQYKYLLRILPDNKFPFKCKKAPSVLCDFCSMHEETNAHLFWECWYVQDLWLEKVREKSRDCHNHKPQPFPDPKRKRKPTNLNKHKPNKCKKRTKISSLFSKRGNCNTKRTVQTFRIFY